MLLNRYKVETYTFSEFREKATEVDLNLVDKILHHIKKNKKMYLRLVFITALLLNLDILIYANGFSDSLDRVGNIIVDMLIAFAKWGCLSFGLRDATITILNGGSPKDAITHSLMYLILFVFISLYPQLYTLFSGIKF